MDLPNLRPSAARKMAAQHKDEIVRLMAAGSPQKVQLWPPSVKEQGLPPSGDEDLGGFGCAPAGHPMPSMASGLWKA